MQIESAKDLDVYKLANEFAMETDDLLIGLPGEVLLRKGLVDLRSGQCTIASCLVAIARPRLVNAGLIADPVTPRLAEPELQLYRLLRSEGGDVYSRYNSLLRELVSFETALDRRTRTAAQRSQRH
jgi:hypothetical protein